MKTSISKFLLLTLMGVWTASCESLMHDDIDACPQGLVVDFIYDYNIERADMFPDHVGSVTLFVYDKAGHLVRTQTEDNSTTDQPLRQLGYRMKVDGLKPGEYQLVALAQQRPYQQTAQESGVRYIRQTGELLTDLNTQLNLMPDGTPATSISQPLDTLWHGTLRSTSDLSTRADANTENTAQTVTVKEQRLTRCTMSLVRDTKRLHLSLRQLDDPAHCNIDDYDISITDQNGRLLHDNSVDTEGTPLLTYQPFATWNTYYNPTTGSAAEQRPDNPEAEETAHADIDFNRLMLRSADSNAAPAMLTIRLRATGEEIVRINLPEMLAQGRGAFERTYYTPQGFLDRCYDYRLDFILKGNTWQYVSLGIHTLPWALRIQNTQLQ